MAYVQSSTRNPGSVASDAVTLSAVTALHCGLVAIRISNGNDRVTGVADDVNGAWTQIANVQNAGATGRRYIYKRESMAAGQAVITVTLSSATTIRWGVAEYSEQTVEDIDAANFTSTSTPSSPATTATGAETIVSIISTDASSTIDPAGGEIERFEIVTSLQMQDKAVGAAGSYAGSWTLGTAGAGFAAALALKPAASSAVATPGLGSATMAGLAPTLNTEQGVLPGVGAVLIQGLIPTLEATLDASIDRGHVNTGRRWHGRQGKYEGTQSYSVALALAAPETVDFAPPPLGFPVFKPLEAFPVGVETPPYVVPPELLAASRARIKAKKRRREEELLLLNLL